MRALFEDKMFVNQEANYHVDEVFMPGVNPNNSGERTSAIDLWFRMDISEAKIYAFKTRAEAITDPVAATYIASGSLTVPTTHELVTFARNGTSMPDMSGLQAYVTTTAPTHPVDVVWAYTCCPQIVAAEDIVTILRTYTGVDEALYDFDKLDASGSATGYASDHIKVAHPVKANVFPFIAVLADSREGAGSGWTGGIMAGRYPITIYVISGGFGDPFDERIQNQRYLAAIESIVCDERRSNIGGALILEHQNTVDPDAADYEGFRWESHISLIAEYNALWRDDQYPRP